MSIRSSSVLLSTFFVGLAVAACSTSDADSESTDSSQAMTQIERKKLDDKLAFLTAEKTSLEPIDATSTEGKDALAKLAAAMGDDPDVDTWIKNAGTEAEPHLSNVTFKDGGHAQLVTREWLVGDAKSPKARSALVYVVPPKGEPFTYGERHRYFGNVDKSTLFVLDKGAGLRPIDSSTFDPSQIKVSSNGDVSPKSNLQILGNEPAAAATSSEEKAKNSLACVACADVLLVAKVLGVGAAYSTGTGASTVICGIVGIPTAEVAGPACHLLIVALSSAMLLPWTFDERAGVCGWVSHEVLGLPNICPNQKTVAPAQVPVPDVGTPPSPGAP